MQNKHFATFSFLQNSKKNKRFANVLLLKNWEDVFSNFFHFKKCKTSILPQFCFYKIQKIKWIFEIWHFGYFSLGCFRYEFCHLWVRFWDGSWCVVNLKSFSFQNVYGYVQEAKISAREAQLPIRSEKHLKLKFWQTSRFLNVFSDFPLVQATLDMDVARCECDINMVVGALYTLGLTLSKHDMIKFASVALRAEGGAFS